MDIHKPIEEKKQTKRNNLVADEQKISFDYTTKPNNQEKYFANSCYIYTNGTSHLGHFYTISKVEFMARYKRLRGFNVLYPLAFHGSGMPIVACANKIKEELEKHTLDEIKTLPNDNQLKIMYNMEIPLEILYKFVDPYYWLDYFPERAKADFKRFGASVDYTRCFGTTDHDKYYDSFIKWQFNKLNKDKYIKFGKNPVIYSPLDKQVCTDHDRSVGEGVNPKKYFVMFCEIEETDTYFTIMLEAKKKVKFVQVNESDDYIIIAYDGKTIITTEDFYRNLTHQTTNKLEKRGLVKGAELINKTVKIGSNKITITQNTTPKIITTNDITNDQEDLIYYEPEKEVISRTGDKCVVAIIDQWFIDYSNDKNIINDYIINKLEINCNDARELLKKTSDWITYYPVSRAKGIGTKLLDTEYLIDSLSDSTIYMSFYTIANNIRKIPITELNDAIFESIFCDAPCDTEHKHNEIINTMKKEFQYFKNQDLRVSGKDLTTNHLTMCLYTHHMIWKTIDMEPKRYHINGHLLLNGEKMSKSTGNFLTLKNALDTYGADATRFTLAECGGVNMIDANFVEDNANNAILKITTEKEWCMRMLDTIPKEQPENNIWSDLFEQEMNQCMMDTELSYEKMDFARVLLSGFYNMTSAKDKYLLKCKNLILISPKHIKKYIEKFLVMMQPICPFMVEHITTKYNIQLVWKTEPVNTEILYYSDTMNKIMAKCRSDVVNIIKRNTKLGKPLGEINIATITCYNNYCDNTMIDKIKTMHQTGASLKEITFELMKNKKEQSKLIGDLTCSVNLNIQKYTTRWFDFDTTKMNECIVEWLPKIFSDDNIKLDIKIEDSANDLKYSPFNQKIEII